jgi:hypothetical protein
MKAGESARHLIFDLRHTFLFTWKAPFNEPALSGSLTLNSKELLC